MQTSVETRDLTNLAIIQVLNKDLSLKEIVTVTNTDGSVAEYHGLTRSRAFELVFGWKPSEREVVDQTRAFSPRTVTLERAQSNS